MFFQIPKKLPIFDLGNAPDFQGTFVNVWGNWWNISEVFKSYSASKTLIHHMGFWARPVFLFGGMVPRSFVPSLVVCMSFACRFTKLWMFSTKGFIACNYTTDALDAGHISSLYLVVYCHFYSAWILDAKSWVRLGSKLSRIRADIQWKRWYHEVTTQWTMEKIKSPTQPGKLREHILYAYDCKCIYI